jgi:hypothetical protein
MDKIRHINRGRGRVESYFAVDVGSPSAPSGDAALIRHKRVSGFHGKLSVLKNWSAEGRYTRSEVKTLYASTFFWRYASFEKAASQIRWLHRVFLENKVATTWYDVPYKFHSYKGCAS